MGLALALIVMGVLIFLDRLGTGYGLREGWPWLVVALGIGGLFRNSKKCACLDYSDPRDANLGCEILLHPIFDPFHNQDILSTGPFDRHPPILALEI